jgi:hypothetical protein
MSVIPAQKTEAGDFMFEASLGYIVSLKDPVLLVVKHCPNKKINNSVYNILGFVQLASPNFSKVFLQTISKVFSTSSGLVPPMTLLLAINFLLVSFPSLRQST